ncbi:MAG: phosphoribosylformylglycinamidine cyclo-ligase [Candidatus Omnitrophica bacterium]|nr:phosphoribosylformylglycinamidine cyclo-ligase [Candidatus Omnitrophota bacterium]
MGGKKREVTYQKAGVNVDKGNEFVRRIKPLAKSTNVPGLVSGIGGFSALFDIGVLHYKQPLIVSTTDGVGTKLELAQLTGIHDTVGIDLVAMCVNDLVTCGAKPLFFLDYFATGKLELKESEAIIRGIVKGCCEAGCTLTGGETAEMPGFYEAKQYDLAGFAIGAVEKSKVIDGKSVKKGDSVLGLASSGFHSNGFSLVRKLYSKSELSGGIGKKFLTPTRIYVKPILSLIKKVHVKALAHITGGGFYDNIPRVLPKGLGVLIDMRSWEIPPLFWQVMERGSVSLNEMFRTFNMGIGMVAVVSSRDVSQAKKILKSFSINAFEIGQIVPREGVVVS